MSEPKPETPGSSRLSQEQTEWYEDRFGEKYRYVQDRPYTLDETGQAVPRASRRERRRNKYKPRKEGGQR